MSVVRRLLGETTVYGLSAALTSAIGFATLPVYTRVFSPSEYGALAQVNVTTSLATVLVIFGLDNSSAVWFFDHPADEERKRTFSTWYSFAWFSAAVLAVLAFLLRGPLARGVLRDGSLSVLWTLFALNVLAANIPRIGSVWYRMVHAPFAAMGLNAVPGVVGAAVGITLVLRTTLGLSGVLIGQVAGSWLGAMVTAVALRKVLSVRRFEMKRLRPMVAFSFPLVVMTKLSWLIGSAITFFVNLLCSREDAGLYQVGASMAGVLSLIMFAFAQAWAPSALAIRDDDEARKVYGIAVEVCCALGLILAVMLGIAAEPLLVLIAHPAYVPAKWVLAILAVNVVVINIPSILAVTFARAKTTLPLLKATAAGAVVTLGLLPFLARWMGKEGAALSVLLGSLVIVHYAFRESQRVFRIEVNGPRLALSCVMAVAVAGAGFAVRPLLHSTVALFANALILSAFVTVLVAVLYRRPLARGLAELRSARAGGP